MPLVALPAGAPVEAGQSRGELERGHRGGVDLHQFHGADATGGLRSRGDSGRRREPPAFAQRPGRGPCSRGDTAGAGRPTRRLDARASERLDPEAGPPRPRRNPEACATAACRAARPATRSGRVRASCHRAGVPRGPGSHSDRARGAARRHARGRHARHASGGHAGPDRGPLRRSRQSAGRRLDSGGCGIDLGQRRARRGERRGGARSAGPVRRADARVASAGDRRQDGRRAPERDATWPTLLAHPRAASRARLCLRDHSVVAGVVVPDPPGAAGSWCSASPSGRPAPGFSRRPSRSWCRWSRGWKATR